MKYDPPQWIKNGNRPERSAMCSLPYLRYLEKKNRQKDFHSLCMHIAHRQIVSSIGLTKKFRQEKTSMVMKYCIGQKHLGICFVLVPEDGDEYKRTNSSSERFVPVMGNNCGWWRGQVLTWHMRWRNVLPISLGKQEAKKVKQKKSTRQSVLSIEDGWNREPDNGFFSFPQESSLRRGVEGDIV
jgi:hypothetical protein